MRSAKLTAPGCIEIIHDHQGQKLIGDEVLVNVKAAGICGSDLHIYQGHRADVALPRIMGHEAVGEVVEVGPEVKQFKIGDHVTIDPVISCGECYSCKKGWNNLCDTVKCLGVQMDGAYCDEMKISQKNLYKISEDLSWEMASLIEPFSIAAEVLDKSNLKVGERVVVMGSGTIGLCILQVFKMMGAKVLIADMVESRLSKAKEQGADVVVNRKTEDLKEAVARFTNNEGAEIVIDAVGYSKLMEEAITFSAPGGRVVVLGFDGEPAEIAEVMFVKKGVVIKGSRMNCHKFPQVIEWFENKKVDPAPLISAIYSFEDINKAFKDTLENKEDFIKVVLKY